MDNNEVIMELVRSLGGYYKDLFNQIEALKNTRATREGQLMILGKVDDILKKQQDVIGAIAVWQSECAKRCAANEANLKDLTKFQTQMQMIESWEKLRKVLTCGKAIITYVVMGLFMVVGAGKSALEVLQLIMEYCKK